MLSNSFNRSSPDIAKYVKITLQGVFEVKIRVVGSFTCGYPENLATKVIRGGSEEGTSYAAQG
jgi:hypothetical protein